MPRSANSVRRRGGAFGCRQPQEERERQAGTRWARTRWMLAAWRMMAARFSGASWRQAQVDDHDAYCAHGGHGRRAALRIDAGRRRSGRLRAGGKPGKEATGRACPRWRGRQRRPRRRREWQRWARLAVGDDVSRPAGCARAEPDAAHRPRRRSSTPAHEHPTRGAGGAGPPNARGRGGGADDAPQLWQGPPPAPASRRRPCMDMASRSTAAVAVFTPSCPPTCAVRKPPGCDGHASRRPLKA